MVAIEQYGSVGGKLQPVYSNLHEEITATFLPNERKTIDDCHLRYYKYGKQLGPMPTFGSPVYLREFAHMAAVGWTKPDKSIEWNCGGSLIWENYVLTAAHCAVDNDNVQPDVVRLGDINLYNNTDDQYAQQLKIAEIIRYPEHRFNSRYHDLALLRLEKNVVLHDTVAPGCLWEDEEIPFPSMDATGWGATGFAQQHTPILLKVSLSVVQKAQCEQYYRVDRRGLKQGLQSYQLCAGDIKMDTCPGDSGGPLQTKLLSNGKMTPFVVAVTSFGTICGQSIPGVYMRVAPYIPWIRSELAKRREKVDESSFKPYACALRYAHLREYEDDVVIDRSESEEAIDCSKAHMEIINSTQTVKIHWPVGRKAPDDCYGVVIDEDTVLTLARCAVFESVSASHTVHNGIRNDIIRVVQHPMYKAKSYYHDIAVLKMKKRFKFSPDFVPACIWNAFKLPDPRFYVTGHGRLDLNEFNYFSEKITTLKPEIVQLSPRSDIRNCTVPEDYRSGLSRGLTQEHLCFGNKVFLVPGSCQMQHGAPIRRNVWRMDRYFEHIYGLNLAGKDCGFGRPALATRLGFHLEWLNSVLLPNNQPSRKNHNIKKIKIPNSTAKELDDCESRYKMFHRTLDYRSERINQFFHTVYLGRQTGGKMIGTCTGTLIARNLVITSAFCLKGEGALPTVVNIAEGAPNVTKSRPKAVKIGAITVHPGYNPKTYEHDIALVRLEKSIVPTAQKYPICLWQNETHTPFLLHRMVTMEDGESSFVESYPKYNSDCQEYLKELGGHQLNSTQFCTDIDQADVAPLSGEPIVWYRRDLADNTTTQYLVGIVSFGNAEVQLGVDTRISSYVTWIKNFL
ncbi:serine protease 53-like [Anopheles ziemanni]|uniref:serine protease 53-like n=1 Tax=Anopheles coustani TaxID=139045 RepID=UPI002658EEB9|nr:serine protease 53-like [Anopheles coustani]XP_058177144.1 serine protease 53-like [Anopheles ziemanni]